ncbi:JAB domain-containing protein [Sphingopyxis indica]|uniref:DNA repair protein RadC n=1 Tax=Sphingopyxis indica TaxID=436663 RepID=A0A239ELR5_9SPHN|nr:JAB domain-containing protein [Sphingopyxis indica]SNS45509.1 DNA repair protein RadC [Sphingopyxis indica]
MTKVDQIDEDAALARPDGFTPLSAEDEFARLLLRPHFAVTCETLVLAGFDAIERLTAVQPIEATGADRCRIAPHRWRAVLTAGTQHVLIAHNHPSGEARPSRADLDFTRKAADFLANLGIDLIDHLIFVDTGHFSFRRAGLL